METSSKSITNIRRWRRTAVVLGSALAMSLATTAFAAGAPKITSSKTATGQVGVAFSYQITADQAIPSGGWGTTVSIPGVTFTAATGLFSGIPTTTGTFSGNVTATNPNGTGSQTLTVTINPATPVVNSSGTATGQVGVAFSYQITATNSPTSFGASGLPAGLSVNTTTGAISGTPTTAGGPTNVTISATNAGGTGTKTLAVTINPPVPTVTSSATTSGTFGVAFSYQITANQAIPSGGWGTTVSIPGVSFSTATGLFSGTPTQLGTFSGNITATNVNGTGTKALTVTINPAPHTAPTASFTMLPTAVWEGDTVELDGSASHTNPDDGSPLIYTWQQQAPSVGILAISLSPQPPKEVVETFIAPAPQPLGALSWLVDFQLKVTDNLVPGGNKNTTSPDVTTTVYAAPVADAEPKDAHVSEGTLNVQLSGSATNPQPGATFSYKWTAPAGITLFPGDTAQNPTFTAPQVGPAGQALTFTLVVTEHIAGLAHDKDSAPDSVTINVDNVNQAPTAIANTINDPYIIHPMATVAENTAGVTLYGFGTDPDNDSLTFSWTQVGGITVALSGDNTATPTFTAPNLTTQDHVDLVFQLIVNDGHLSSGPSTVTIRVNNTNDPPLAVPAATPSAALEHETVTLDGHLSSDPNMDPLTYTWAQTGAPPSPVVTLTPSGSNATFTAPTVSAQQGSITLDFELTVSDGEFSDTKPISVTVSHINQTPVADAGMDQPGVPELSQACLDGSGSYDPDGNTDSLHYAWLQVPAMGEPIVGLNNPSSIQPCFDTPDVGPGGVDLHFQLTVTDSHMASSSDTVLVHVSYVNQPPTANAGDDQTVNEVVDTVHLNGSGTDPDLNTLTYTWNQLSGPHVTLSSDTDPLATFTAPSVFCAGDVVVMRLTVDDGFGGVTTDDVNITIANVNHNPTADAGGNQSGKHEGELVQLNGTGNDADTEEVRALAFQWTQTSGTPVSLVPIIGNPVSFTAPTIPGGDPNASLDLEFTLTVSDTCDGSTTTMPVNVHVANTPHAPVAVAQANPISQNEGGSTVQLDGSMSHDQDIPPDPITYTWEQTAGPAVTLVYSPGDTTAHVMPSFVTPWVSADTPLTFKLTVSDWPGSTSTAYVTVTVINSHTPPDASHARADVPVLWPPDHKMAQVHIIGLVNPNNDPVTIDTVRQDEPTNGLGDGDTPIDAIISGDSVTLRAERSGNGNGRVYHVCFTVQDPEQNATGCVNVSVPKSKKTDVAIDGGPLYDSTH